MWRRRGRFAAVLALAVNGAVLAGAAPTSGQVEPDAPAPREEADAGTRGWCFLADPAPRCASYPILEVQGTWGLASTLLERPIGFDQRAFDEFNLEFSLGHAFNLSPRWGLGGFVTLGTNVGGVDGVRARLRYWASSIVSLEADAGMIRTNLGSYAPISAGPSAGVRANLFDVGTLGLRYDAVKVPVNDVVPSGWQSGLSLTGGFAGPAAIVASGLIGVGVMAFIVAFAGIAL